MQIVVLADDLSGAAELGALGWRYGLTAEVQSEFEPSSSADLCLIDTDSRSCPVDAAVRRVAQIARRLIALPPVFVFKKVDSLLRGHVLAETRAIARSLGRQRVLLIPANPSRGRVIRDGRYFVDGVPLDKTLFAADPDHPRRSSQVRELLDESTAGRLSAQVAAGLSEIHVAVPDVASGADVAEWARQIGADTLPAGAADFFAAILADRCGRDAAPADIDAAAPELPAGRSRTLVVCGSAAAWPVRYADARAAGIPCVVAPAEIFATDRRDAVLRSWGDQIAEALRTRRCVLVGLGDRPLEKVPPMSAGAPNTTAAVPGGALARRLAEAVAQAVRQAPVDRFLLEGGATAAAFARAQGWSRLCVTGAPGAGVAELRPTVMAHGTSPVILVKPGSYPWPSRVWKSVVADGIGGAGPAQA